MSLYTFSICQKLGPSYIGGTLTVYIMGLIKKKYEIRIRAMNLLRELVTRLQRRRNINELHRVINSTFNRCQSYIVKGNEYFEILGTTYQLPLEMLRKLRYL